MKKSYVLTLDIGNTNQTLCLFDLKTQTLLSEKIPYSEIESFTQKNGLDQTNTIFIASSVKDSLLSNTEKSFKMARSFFKEALFLDMPIQYEKTIGDDRLVSSYYLYKKSLSPKILIDSGSFTTLDIIEEQGHTGGIILPGLKRLQESYHYGENLGPFAQEYSSSTSFLENNSLPNSSKDAVAQGIELSFYAPIRQILEKYPKYLLFITGGSSKYLKLLIEIDQKQRKSSIHLENNLIHISLCYIASIAQDNI